ncbi:hypothetical protein L1N85_10660 [Paenibacillus alkaliterrae]|uniref:hypothetical protein n=1 Tax=Paenibacillus alkaliterrae TaxID=320909 RepID=UPI001F2FD895|nr:hypothetical protein [Paenibacillus alkaliterrae]MCF2938897.1 hypothetical protein [Paenibacillus alkaliterrae]
MAIPMSAAQTQTELQRKKSLGIPPTSSANQAQYNALKPMATPKPAMGGAIPPTTPKPIKPFAATPKAAQSSHKGAIPQMVGNTAAVTPVTPVAAQTQPKGAIPNMAPTYNEAAATNYGGKGSALNEILYSKKSYDAGNKAWAASNAQQHYGALSADEATAVKGMNTQQLIDYIGSKNQPKTDAGKTDNGGYYPTNDAVAGVRTSNELLDQSGDLNAIERAALQNAANERQASLRNNAGYVNQQLKDQRTLEDFWFDETHDPFNGRTSYDKAMVGRERTIADAYRGANLENQLNAVQQELYNFDKLAPERQRQVYNQMLQMERDFGLNVGQLTGSFGGQRTLAGQAQDWGQTVDTANLTGMFNGQQTAQQTQQEWQNRFNYGNAIGQFGNGQQTMENKQFKASEAQRQWENAFTQGQFDFQKAQTAYENAFKDRSFQQDMQEAAASRGLQWASLGQRQKEFVADQAFREKQFEYEQGQDAIANDLAAQKANSPGEYSYKSDPDFMTDAAAMVKSPGEARVALRDNAQAYIDKYGIEGYNYLITTINK